MAIIGGTCKILFTCLGTNSFYTWDRISSNMTLISITTTLVRFEVFTGVTMKNAVFWDMAPCSSCVNRRFGGTYRLHLQGRKIREWRTSVSRWLADYYTYFLENMK
jgi:hypothetical protein